MSLLALAPFPQLFELPERPDKTGAETSRIQQKQKSSIEVRERIHECCNAINVPGDKS
jgi:hypothetical protein